jgi:hypothetical protein
MLGVCYMARKRPIVVCSAHYQNYQNQSEIGFTIPPFCPDCKKEQRLKEKAYIKKWNKKLRAIHANAPNRV